jgi:hypothetical protein
MADVDLQGWLLKKGHVRRNWKERYFILKGNSLSYYEKPPKTEKTEPLGVIPLAKVPSLSYSRSFRIPFHIDRSVFVLFPPHSFHPPSLSFCIAGEHRDGLREEGPVGVHDTVGAAGRGEEELLCAGEDGGGDASVDRQHLQGRQGRTRLQRRLHLLLLLR